MPPTKAFMSPQQQPDEGTRNKLLSPGSWHISAFAEAQRILSQTEPELVDPAAWPAEYVPWTHVGRVSERWRDCYSKYAYESLAEALKGFVGEGS